jgi:hypothetical protein
MKVRMKCHFETMCPYHRRKMPNREEVYQNDLKRYCLADPGACAIYQLIENSGYLKVPKDLYPDQHFRLRSLLIKQ